MVKHKTKLEKLRDKVLGNIRSPIAKEMLTNKGVYGMKVVKDKKKAQHDIRGNKGNMKKQWEQNNE